MSQVLPLTPTVRAMVKRADDAPKLWQAEAAADRMGTLRSLLADLAAGVPQAEALRAWSAVSGKSVVTGRRWLAEYTKGGAQALTPQWKHPQEKKVQEMAPVILRAYNDGSRPNCGTISNWIKNAYNVDISAGQIRRFIKSLPAIAAEQSPGRMGKHTYDMKVRPYVERDATVFDVGEAIHADGHCMKVWCLHPVSGEPRRMEFTPILDIRSNYMWAFWLAEAESADDTAFALCRMIHEHQHAPALFYTDPGPGFKNVRVKALLDKLGITHMISRGGNSRGRGFGEGFFRLFIERFAKRYQACCSRDRTDDTFARFRTKWKHGEIYVPPFAELQAHLNAFRDEYNRTPQPHSKRLMGKSPQQLKEESGWCPNRVTVPVHQLIRPSRELTVRGGALKVFKRRYVAQDLLGYERRKVIIEHDLCDLGRLWVWAPDGRFVCEAPCIHAQPYVPASYLEEVRAKSDAQKLKLLERHADEVRARSARVFSASSIVDAMETLDASTAPALPNETALIEQGHSLAAVEAEPRAPRKPRAVPREALEHLRAEVEADAAPIETTTTHDRIRRALDLEARAAAGETLTDEDARWLAIYATSDEYHSRRSLMDDFDLNQPET